MIRCWTVLRHVGHRAHHHARRIGHYVAAHKAATMAPIVVCATVGGAGLGWMASPGAAGSGGFPAGAFGGPPIEFGGGGGAFAGGVFATSPPPVELVPAELVLPPGRTPEFAPPSATPPEFAPTSPPSMTPPEFVPVAFTPGQPVPEPSSLALLVGLAALVIVARRKMAS